MNQKPKRQIFHWFSVIVVGIALGLTLQFVRAWTEPTVDPPGGNIGAPINTGGLFQGKDAGLMVNGLGISSNGLLVPYGNVGIGTASPATKLEVSGGPIKATGGLIIETRSSDPPSPANGQIWLISP